MSFIDWNAAALPSAIQGQNTQNAQQQLALIQQRRAMNAFQGVDVGDPASVQAGINKATQYGLVDQASALTNLAQQRGINQASLPNIQTLGSMFGGKLAQEQALSSQPQQSQQPSQSQFQQSDNATGLPDDFAQAHKDQMLWGANALRDLDSLSGDPGVQAAQAAVYKQEAIAKGFPADAVERDFADPTKYGALAQHLEDWANGAENPAPHPTDNQEGRSFLQSIYNPGAENAAGVLNDPFWTNPAVMGFAQKYLGVDLTPGVNANIAMTGAGRQGAAGAAFAGPQAFATTTATNIANLNTLPATQFAVQRAAAEGQAAGSPMDITLQDGSKEKAVLGYDQDGKPYAIPVGSPPAGGGNANAPNVTGAGPAAGPGRAGAPIVAPSPQTQGTYTASAAQLATDRANAAGSMNQQVALGKILDLLPTTNTGPGTQVTNGWRSFLLSQLPMLEKLNPNLTADQIQTANANELKKYMIQVSSGAAAQFGQGTNEKLAVAASGNPNTEMDALSARDVTRTTRAILRANIAMPQLFAQQHPDPADVGQYSQWAANYAATVDPRAFMLDMMTAPERQKMLAGITSASDKRRFAQGVIDAEQAGFINRADLPK